MPGHNPTCGYLSSVLDILADSHGANSRSILIACLKEVDPIVGHTVDKPVFLRDPSQPAALEHIPKWLRFRDILKRITHRCLHQIDGPSGSERFSPVFEDLLETPSGRPRHVWRYGPLTISRLSSRRLVGCTLPLSARRKAESNRRAFRGDRRRCAVSINPANSVAGMSATSRAPLRRTITTSCRVSTPNPVATRALANLNLTRLESRRRKLRILSMGRKPQKNDSLPGSLDMLILRTLSLRDLHGYGIVHFIRQ